MTIAPYEDPDRMTPSEAVSLCRFVKACCPQQAIDEYTPDAWFELLRDLRLEDCHSAAVAVARRQPFVSPAEIRDEVYEVRNQRIRRFGPIPRQPEDLTAGLNPHVEADFYEISRREREWHRNLMQDVGDGKFTRTEYDELHPPPPPVPVEPGGYERAMARLRQLNEKADAEETV